MKVVALLCFFSIGLISESSYTEEGYASYYAKKFEGRKTASGEVYKGKKMTAAHKTLPFNTEVRVTNLSNMNVVKVRINDRLGKKSPHIIDLSIKAAKELDFISKGKTKVKIEEIK